MSSSRRAPMHRTSPRSIGTPALVEQGVVQLSFLAFFGSFFSFLLEVSSPSRGFFSALFGYLLDETSKQSSIRAHSQATALAGSSSLPHSRPPLNGMDVGPVVPANKIPFLKACTSEHVTE